MTLIDPVLTRRNVLKSLTGAAALAATTLVAPPIRAAASSATTTEGALAGLTRKLATAPRRRSFDAVPLIAHEPRDWDHEAAAELLAYRYRPSQVWDNADIAGPWPALMREALNGQVYAHHHVDFLEVGAMHGTAHLALFNQAIWDRYSLAKLTAGKLTRNSLIVEPPGRSSSDDLEKPDGFYGPANNNIVSLQERGMVFVACHDSIHAIARTVRDSRPGESADRIAAQLTNNLIPGAVLVPSVVAFLAELEQAGFCYVKS